MKTLLSAFVLAVILITASCSSSEDASKQTITIDFDLSKGCTPEVSNATAGTFTIVANNVGNGIGELEVIDGDRVRGEAENIPGGQSRKFIVKLDEGEYTLACGKLNSFEGKLVVGPAVSDAPTLKVNEKELEAATKLYKEYVVQQTELLAVSSKTLTDAVRANNLEGAKKSFGPSREPWEGIEPIAELFAKFDVAIDARVDDFDSEEDPNFTGFHKIEYVVFELNSTENLEAIANKLDDDIAGLTAEIKKLDIDPLDMAKGAQVLMEEIANGKITGEEDRYSHTDLYDFNANVEGSVKIIDLLRDLLDSVDPKLTKEFDDSIGQVNDRLSTYKNSNGTWDSYEELTDDDRKVLKADIAALSELLSEVPGTLGLG